VLQLTAQAGRFDKLCEETQGAAAATMSAMTARDFILKEIVNQNDGIGKADETSD
jgi:hypothetical protein